jgi:thiol:disulfide interchange protein DsbG
MRSVLLLACVLLLPEMALAAPQCALSSPSANLVAATSASPVDNRTLPPTPAADVPAAPLATITPAEANKVPALDHIAQSGAELLDLGVAHGLDTVFARHGDQFMLLEVTPDGQAVVAGLPSDMSVAQILAVAGTHVTELGTVHGLRGLLVRNGSQFQVLYATPDGERVIPGVMWDAAGKNVTREQVAPIAGTIPTVVVGRNVGASPAASQDTKSPLALVKDTRFGTYGSPSAPRVWMFIDPQCSFSIRAMQQLQPYVASGRVQLAVIPLSVLDYEDQGLSTTRALAMLSKPTDQMVDAWSRGDLNGPPDAAAGTQLSTNMAAAAGIQLQGTPTFVWRKADGNTGRADGLPTDLNAMIASIGR